VASPARGFYVIVLPEYERLGSGTDDLVVGLVYIAALAPDAHETSQSQLDKFPRTDVFSYVEVADGRAWMFPEGVECFAGDLSEQEKKVVWATHFAPAADIFSHGVEGTAWRSKPSWNSNASQRSAWVPQPMSLRAVTCPCSPNRNG